MGDCYLLQSPFHEVPFTTCGEAGTMREVETDDELAVSPLKDEGGEVCDK